MFNRVPEKIQLEYDLIVEGFLLSEPSYSEHKDSDVLCRSRNYELKKDKQNTYLAVETQYYNDPILGTFTISIPRFEISIANNQTQTIAL